MDVNMPNWRIEAPSVPERCAEPYPTHWRLGGSVRSLLDSLGIELISPKR